MKPFIDEISDIFGINRLDLVEKDILLHKLLNRISDEELQNDFLFKGGTCLIKCYLGYYRFSEDLDFTWRDQEPFQDKSGKEIRRYLSGVIDQVGERFENISEDVGLDFACDKSDRHWVEIGGSNKMVTFKLWYESEILETSSFIKIQINFVEDIIYPLDQRESANIIDDKGEKNMKSLFPEYYDEYTADIVLPCYDIREILCEKVRSILLRRGVKARDFVDIYKISKKYDLDVSQFRDQVVRKTNFSLDLYKKYKENLDGKRKSLTDEDLFRWGDEREFLLVDVDERDFYGFVDEVNHLLVDIMDELNGV